MRNSLIIFYTFTVPNTSRCLQQLSDSGCIVRVKDENDRRITHINLPPKGSELVEKFIRLIYGGLLAFFISFSGSNYITRIQMVASRFDENKNELL